MVNKFYTHIIYETSKIGTQGRKKSWKRKKEKIEKWKGGRRKGRIIVKFGSALYYAT